MADDDYDEEDTEPSTDETTKAKNCFGCENGSGYVTLGAKLKGLDFEAIRKALPYAKDYESLAGGSSLPTQVVLRDENGRPLSNFEPTPRRAANLTRQNLVEAGIPVRDLAHNSDDEDEGEGRGSAAISGKRFVCAVCSGKSDRIPST